LTKELSSLEKAKEGKVTLKVYFDLHPWTNQDNVFFWANVPATQIPTGSKRFVAELEVPDFENDMEKAVVNNIIQSEK